MYSTGSSDEGEIRDCGLEKATTAPPKFDGSSVDRLDRTRPGDAAQKSLRQNGFSANNRGPRQRSRSPQPGRGPRGSKRTRDDEYIDRRRGDPRDFKVHYEDRHSDYKQQPRPPYDDVDRSQSRSSDLRYDDRDHYADKRARTRSRSPYRAPRQEELRSRGPQFHKEGSHPTNYSDTDKPRSYGYGDRDGRYSTRDQSVSKRGNDPMPADSTRHEAKYGKQHNDSTSDGFNLEKYGPPFKIKGMAEQPSRSGTAAEEPQPADSEPVDEATLIEQRRKRREAIKAKYRGSATPMLVQALQLGNNSSLSSPGKNQSSEIDTQSNRSGRVIHDHTTGAVTGGKAASPALSTPDTPKEAQDGTSPPAFTITNDNDLANSKVDTQHNSDEDGPSAADYDPTADMREDQKRDIDRHNDDLGSGAYDETKRNSEQDVLLPEATAPVVESKKPKDDFDMFAEDDDDDMFAEEPTEKKQANKENNDVAKAVPIPEAKELDVAMLDNWDDPEGYYKVILGELLDRRYHVQANLGRGMFSGVVRAMDVTTKRLVAIKIIRNNETMRKAGNKEIEILEKLKEGDPEDKKHMIRLERHFEHKNHLCMVFEHLSINLREVLKKFGRDVGINLRAVRAYAQQMFLGLGLMRKCNILHADLKPDNILVNEGRNLLKICDLGSASDASENEVTPYLVSRFYRAPEIILGMPYDFAIDVWSVGCTLYELYTGKILFTGRTNNQMLRSIMECRGKFTTKMLRRAQFVGVHFDEMSNFRSVEQDKLTGKDVVKILNMTKPSRDLRTRLMAASKGLSEAESKELTLFADLLDRCLALNPEKRCTPAEALRHPFIVRDGGLMRR